MSESIVVARSSAAPVRHVASLDALRGLAALAVVFFHVSLFAQQSLDPHLGSVQHTLSALRLTPLFVLFAGSESVLVFFILSGFVLYLMLAARPMPYAVYVRRRLLRLYPPYLVAVLVSMGLASLLGGHAAAGFGPWVNTLWQRPPDLTGFLYHVLVIGNPNTEPYNFVLWSLVQEMQISLLFPLLYAAILRVRPAGVLAGCLGLSLAANAVALMLAHVAPTAAYVLTPYLDSAHYLLFFAIGALMARHPEAVGRWYGALPVWVKGLVVAGGVACYTYGHVLMLRLGVASRVGDLLILPGAFTLVLLFAHSLRVTRLSRSAVPQFLGRISYSLYLYHGVVLMAFVYGLGGRLPVGVLLALALVTVLPVCVAAYHLVERPSIEWSRRGARRSVTAPPDGVQG
ncbi:acyltransferase (plasmid) [Deinococcus taeanensis]|uniref:acyltransferase family protein n=1 Tax=Deinococcus taeanensis TaxID=2737050 RepID=UPI001CDD01CD|nr:acyltransferase [Deinococcus taeanensis]UBV44310.1 acyltransferase [Deinococcus taeanensis]